MKQVSKSICRSGKLPDNSFQGGLAGQPESFHRLSLPQMFADYLIHIFFSMAAIPYPLGVDHHTGAQLTAIQAAGAIYACFADTGFLHFSFHVIAQFIRVFISAAAALMAGLAFVGAAEDVAFKKHAKGCRGKYRARPAQNAAAE